MAALVLLALILAMADHSSATWCVCKEGLGESAWQKALDYACGAGADCNPIKSNGACFNPNTVKAHCSFAVNSYFQKKGQAQGSCDFAGTATFSTSDPSQYCWLFLPFFYNQLFRQHNTNNYSCHNESPYHHDALDHNAIHHHADNRNHHADNRNHHTYNRNHHADNRNHHLTVHDNTVKWSVRRSWDWCRPFRSWYQHRLQSRWGETPKLQLLLYLKDPLVFRLNVLVGLKS
ncbi:hypothetical protein JRO89_XS13G0000700 [Xanthoceras sorbifolium]|uniref:X8 domain-containing protein n=1 Tax=Xanthoceras sorbifolium TaxID=99658 RepID=A0ABQ8H5K9_9ROSI|nr:hypothetical protein JRO89_XS13G0000700 [Xanthoceras sorbifolium]